MLFISLEGIDGSGKTTTAKLIKNRLQEDDYDVVLTREPGGNEISEAIRNVILDKKNHQIKPWTEALLYIAARKQHLDDVILPALKQGKIVICDRFMDSTSAYQGYARGLSIRELDEIQNIVLGIHKPNLTLFFDIELQEARQRMNNRGIENLDRLDLEKISFYEKVYEGYQILVSENTERIKVVNSRLEINEVANIAYNYIKNYLKELMEKKDHVE